MSTKKKWSNNQIYWKVESEGLGYVIQHYLNSDSIGDVELAEKWERCSKLLTEIDNILEEAGEEEEGEFED